MIVYNKTQRSQDYSEIASYYRPGHADFTFDQKYGFRDYRGGGRSSGRETIARVAGGAVASLVLQTIGIHVNAYTKSIGPVEIDYSKCSKENVFQSPLYMPDLEASARAEDFLMQTMKSQDSSGGVVECIISGMPAGIGETVFEKLDATLAKGIMSIGAVKGFEIGAGFEAAKMLGSQNNDNFYIENSEIRKNTNNSGGILGGLSDGSEIILRAAFKPTPSISSTQQTISKMGENININIRGRHDPIIVPRGVVVVESMAAMTILDMLFLNMSARMDHFTDFYRR